MCRVSRFRRCRVRQFIAPTPEPERGLPPVGHFGGVTIRSAADDSATVIPAVTIKIFCGMVRLTDGSDELTPVILPEVNAVAADAEDGLLAKVRNDQIASGIVRKCLRPRERVLLGSG